MFKKITFIVLSILLGAVFLLSAYTKLYPIEPFEYTFVDLGFINWEMAPFAARLMIALEFIIGVFLIFNFNPKKFTYKLAITTLVIFCIYLTLLIVLVGDKGNCGCFGEIIKMTPLQALIKNIVMLVLLFLLYKFYAGWQLSKKLNIVISAFLIITFTLLPFILNPVILDYSEAYLNKPETDYKLELDSLYKDATLHVPPKTLSEGKHVIAFMSLSCQHCRTAAKKIRIMKERNPDLPFYFVLNGKDEKLENFFTDTGTKNIPHCILNGKNFVYLAGTQMPTIYLIDNGIVKFNINYFDLNQQEIEKWLEE